VTALPAGGTADIELSLEGIPAGSAMFDAVVLEPFDVDCAVRLSIDLLTAPDVAQPGLPGAAAQPRPAGPA
jgi:hypothetical protein